MAAPSGAGDSTGTASGTNNMKADERTKLLLLTGDYYLNKGSVFVPNARIRLNFVPIVLSTILPWTLFVVLLTISIFRFRHDYGHLCDYIWVVVCGVLLLAYTYLFFKELHSVDPRWTRASCLHLFIMINICLTASYLLYSEYFEPYYDVLDLKTYPTLDVSKTNGKDVMDAGMIYFSQGTKIDFTRTWHFKHKSVYCVAPLVKQITPTAPILSETGSLDFWVTGKDCCSTSSSDFRCPGYDNAKARAGIRILHPDADIDYYRLAVQQAETQYGFLSTYPIFVEWTEDPVYDLEDRKSTGLALYFVLLFSALFLQLFLVCLCTVRFSLIGRRKAGTGTN
ncbi:unnamed protein product [Amoebophrya sp. A120]|nr:unnamed protein product [Amoebophrya sp. A120]|eukprot:GSA120T00000520001.1